MIDELLKIIKQIELSLNNRVALFCSEEVFDEVFDDFKKAFPSIEIFSYPKNVINSENNNDKVYILPINNDKPIKIICEE